MFYLRRSYELRDGYWIIRLYLHYFETNTINGICKGILFQYLPFLMTTEALHIMKRTERNK